MNTYQKKRAIYANCSLFLMEKYYKYNWVTQFVKYQTIFVDNMTKKALKRYVFGYKNEYTFVNNGKNE